VLIRDMAGGRPALRMKQPVPSACEALKPQTPDRQPWCEVPTAKTVAESPPTGTFLMWCPRKPCRSCNLDLQGSIHQPGVPIKGGNPLEIGLREFNLRCRQILSSRAGVTDLGNRQ